MNFLWCLNYKIINDVSAHHLFQPRDKFVKHGNRFQIKHFDWRVFSCGTFPNTFNKYFLKTSQIMFFANINLMNRIKTIYLNVKVIYGRKKLFKKGKYTVYIFLINKICNLRQIESECATNSIWYNCTCSRER